MCACASVKVSAEVKGVGFPGDGVTDGCESLMLVLGAKHGSSEKKKKQRMLLPAGSSSL